jgi:hypothetical protein
MSLSLDLDRIAAGLAGTVTLSGAVHQVNGISAASLKLLRGAQPAEYLDVALTVCKRSVPTLTEGELDTLTPPQIEGILAVATHDVEEVAKLSPDYEPPDPNASGPATIATSPV